MFPFTSVKESVLWWDGTYDNGRAYEYPATSGGLVGHDVGYHAAGWSVCGVSRGLHVPSPFTTIWKFWAHTLSSYHQYGWNRGGTLVLPYLPALYDASANDLFSVNGLCSCVCAVLRLRWLYLFSSCIYYCLLLMTNASMLSERGSCQLHFCAALVDHC